MTFLYGVFSDALQISSLRAFSSALLLLLSHLGVVLHIGHSRVGGLDVVAVDQLQQLEVEEGQELLSDVDGDWLGVGRVEPSEPLTGPGELMVVGGLVQGLLEDVGWVVGEVVDVLSLFMNGEQMSQNKGEQLSQNGG